MAVEYWPSSVRFATVCLPSVTVNVLLSWFVASVKVTFVFSPNAMSLSTDHRAASRCVEEGLDATAADRRVESRAAGADKLLA